MVYYFASQAGIAQLVERNLAKVEVASSSLVSRSRFQWHFFIEAMSLPEPPAKLVGLMAEWSCNGLQIRVRRFDSDSGLQ